ncbi:MAG: hypothetical protein ABJA76_00810, partial [Mucilaginibacter sp.]
MYSEQYTAYTLTTVRGNETLPAIEKAYSEKKYDEVIAKYPDTLMYRFNYANDMFGHIYNGDEGVKIDNKDVLLKSIGTQLQKAASLDPEDINTNWLYGQYYYNTGVDFRDQANAVKG